MWEKQTDRHRYETSAARDKERYERDMIVYRKGGALVQAPKKGKAPPVAEPEEEYEDEEDDDDYEDDEDAE